MKGAEKEKDFKLDQVGYMVSDIRTTARQLEDLLGIGPFEIFEWPQPGEDPESFMNGKPASWRMDIAFADLGNISIELIQPIEGNEMLEEFITQKGSGLHHLRFIVRDFDRAVKEFEQKGYKLLSKGKGVHQGSRWAYFDTREILNGLIIELRSDTSQAVEAVG